MQRLITIIAFLIFSVSVLSAEIKVVDKIPSDSNTIITLTDCFEFKKSADEYYQKAKDDAIFSEKYKLVAKNFEKMYVDCVSTLKKHEAYEGLRKNVNQLHIKIQDTVISNQDTVISNQDTVISNQDTVISNQNEKIKKQDAVIKKQDVVIKSQDKLIERPDKYIEIKSNIPGSQDELIKTLNDRIKNQEEIIKRQDKVIEVLKQNLSIKILKHRN